jgi:4-hydroxybenzoate polyprenyltransferase
MMVGVATQDEELPQRRYFVSSFGMAVVAFVCGLSGAAFGLGRGPYRQDAAIAIFVFLYAILISPYLFSRCSLLEGGPGSRRRISDGRFVPLVVFVALLPGVVLLIAWQRDNLRDWHRLLLLLMIALVAFFYLWIRMMRNLRPNGPARSERMFKSKVLLPAFAICLASFSYGWLLSRPDANAALMLIPVFVIFIGGFVTAARNWIWVLVFIFATVALALAFTISGNEFGSVMFVGTLLTLAMGVAETCKRAVWLRQNHPIFGAVVDRDDGNSKEDANFYLTGANWSSSLFPALLCIVPLLVPQVAVFPTFLVLSIQYLHWHYFAPKKRSVLLIAFNVILGFSLPLVLLAQFYVPFPKIFPPLTTDSVLGIVAIIIPLFAAVVSAVWSDALKEFFLQLFKLKGANYSDPRFCFLLFLSVILVLMVAFVVLAVFGSVTIRSKALETIICLMGLMIFASSAYVVRNVILGNVDPTPQHEAAEGVGGSDFRALGSMVEKILSLVMLTRAPVAIIAGLPTIFLLAIHAGANSTETFLFVLPLVAITMVGFILNDMFDLKADLAAQREKPLAKGAISVASAGTVAFILSCGAILVALEVHKGASLEILVCTLCGVTIYSVVARYLPTLKGVATALLCFAPFLYASSVSGVKFPPAYYVLLFLFIFGRELLLDVRDIDADRLAKVRTLAHVLTPMSSRYIGWVLMAGSLGLAVVFTQRTAQMLFVAAIGSLGFCFYLYNRSENLGLSTSRITLLISAIAASVSL